LQQRTERDASLAEIEESRRRFLQQLKDYKGREVEIINEALTFAGGYVTENEELIDPSGYQIINDANEVSDSQYISRPTEEQIGEDNADGQDNVNEQGNIDAQGNADEQLLHRNQEAFDLYIEGQEEDGSEIMSFLNRNNDRDSINNLTNTTLATPKGVKKSKKHLRAFGFAVNSVKISVTFLGQVIGRIVGHITWPSSKVVVILLSTIVLLSLVDPNEKKKNALFRVSKTTSYGSHHHHHHHLRISEQSSSNANEEENKGDEDYFPKCIVRERVELPFYRDLKGPDVLYGRG
jgi:predicted RNase H-like HicB family nuclease